MRLSRARRSVAALVVAALVLGACSGDDGGKGGVADTGGKGASTKAVLTALANEVIVPSYEALVANLDALDASLGTLCTGRDRPALDAARAAWRDADLAWESTRAGDVGPAIDRRLMSAVGFAARPDEIASLLAGTTPVDPATLA